MNFCPEQASLARELLLGLLFTFLGVVVAFWYEQLGAPRLEFSLEPTLDGFQPNGWRVRFLRLRVTNRPRGAPLVTKQTAYSCHGTIVFAATDREFFTGPMPIRWADSPQPVRMEIVNGQLQGVPEPNLVRMGRFIDIPPGETEVCDVAMRVHDEASAFGWTSESYSHAWRHPSFQLAPGEYVVHVKVTTGDRVYAADFAFSNPPDFESFDFS